VNDHRDTAALASLREAVLAGPDTWRRLQLNSEGDADAATMSIVRQILDAETADDVMGIGDQGATGLRTLARRYVKHDGLEVSDGVPFDVRGFRPLPGEFEEGLPFFLVIDGVRLDTGELCVVTCGSVNVVSQLIALALKPDGLPRVVLTTEREKSTASKTWPLWLVNPSPDLLAKMSLARSLADDTNPLDEE
jgi:hypothetical protein